MGLLRDAFVPITSEIAFVRSEPEELRDWLIRRAGDDLVDVREVFRDLSTALDALLPLVYWSCRFLVVPTRSRWTAYFDNSKSGTDSGGLAGAVALDLQCLSVRSVAVTPLLPGGNKRLEATIFTLWGPEQREELNLIRNVHAINEGGRWDFDASGEPQPFEDPRAYANRRIRDRFTPEMLSAYLLALGIDAMDEAFYVPQRAYLIQERRTERNREFTLEEARADW